MILYGQLVHFKMDSELIKFTLAKMLQTQFFYNTLWIKVPKGTATNSGKHKLGFSFR